MRTQERRADWRILLKRNFLCVGCEGMDWINVPEERSE
jgi:hypothetical protein